MKTDNLKLVGEGNTAEIFDLQDGKVLKLFRKGMPKEIIKAEYLNSIAVSNVLEFVPRVYKMCEVENRTAIVYQKIVGTDYLKVMLKNIFKLNYMAKKLAHIHKSIQVPCNENILTLKEKLALNIKSLQDITDNKKQFVLDYLSKLPDSNVLCHMDFHPGNVMITDKREIVIDWMNACVGDCCGDVMRTCLLLSMGEDTHNPFLIRKIISIFQNHIKKIYLNEYLKITGKCHEDIKVWELPVAAARLTEWVSPHEKEKLLRIVDKYYNDKGLSKNNAK